MRVFPTRKRIALGLALIIIGMILLPACLWAIEELPLFFVAAFISVVAITFGGTIVTGLPVKALLKPLLLVGAVWFLAVPWLFYLSLPPEIPPLALGLSSLLLVLVAILYEKRSTRHHGNDTEK